MTELDKLEAYLDANGYDAERVREQMPQYRHNHIIPDGLLWRDQIIVRKKGKYLWDAICQYGSYGAEQGLLEIQGDIVKSGNSNDVEGWLTADEIIKRLEKR